MMDKARVTITVKGKNLEVLNKMVEATGKQRGDIVSEMVSEVLEGISPLIEETDELSAYKAIFRRSLVKLMDALSE